MKWNVQHDDEGPTWPWWKIILVFVVGSLVGSLISSILSDTAPWNTAETEKKVVIRESTNAMGVLQDSWCADGTNDCIQYRTSVKKARQVRNDSPRIGNTSTRMFYKAVSPEKRLMMKRAYRRYRDRMIAQASSPGTYQAVRAMGRGGYVAVPAAWDWPSPKEWFLDFAASVQCGFAATASHATRTMCADPTPGPYSGAVLKDVTTTVNHSNKFVVKCGVGYTVEGLMSAEGMKQAGRKLGKRVRGGPAFMGATAANCAWNEYFKKHWWGW